MSTVKIAARQHLSVGAVCRLERLRCRKRRSYWSLSCPDRGGQGTDDVPRRRPRGERRETARGRTERGRRRSADALGPGWRARERDGELGREGEEAREREEEAEEEREREGKREIEKKERERRGERWKLACVSRTCGVRKDTESQAPRRFASTTSLSLFVQLAGSLRLALLRPNIRFFPPPPPTTHLQPDPTRLAKAASGAPSSCVAVSSFSALRRLPVVSLPLSLPRLLSLPFSLSPTRRYYQRLRPVSRIQT